MAHIFKNKDKSDVTWGIINLYMHRHILVINMYMYICTVHYKQNTILHFHMCYNTALNTESINN